MIIDNTQEKMSFCPCDYCNFCNHCSYEDDVRSLKIEDGHPIWCGGFSGINLPEDFEPEYMEFE